MADSITDVASLKDFLRQRAKETWEERGIPYYLSLVATDLKRKGVDYRTFTGPFRLVQWVGKEAIPDTKLIAHPTVKAKVGLIPADADYDFSQEAAVDEPPTQSHFKGKRGRALLTFVETLALMPEDAAAEFSIPAKVLIALLRS